jgi:hypothetical protein
VTDPGQVLRAAIAFNDLPGMTPLALPCPLPLDVYVDRIVFHTATGDVSVAGNSAGCGYGLTVRRDGHQVGPQLARADTFLSTLGLHR